MASINIFSPYFMVIYVTSTVRVTNWMSHDASANHDGTTNKMTNHDQQLTVPRYAINVSFLRVYGINIHEDIIPDLRSTVPKFVVNIPNYVSKL